MKLLFLILLAPIWIPCYAFVWTFLFVASVLGTFMKWMTTDNTWKRSWKDTAVL